MSDLNQRSYRIGEMVRQRNDREHQKLLSSIYGKRGMAKYHQMKLDELDKDRDMIKRELSMIRTTVATTYGNLPPNKGEESKRPGSHPKKALNARTPHAAGRKESLSDRRPSELRKDVISSAKTNSLSADFPSTQKASSQEPSVYPTRSLNKDNMEQARGKVRQRLTHNKEGATDPVQIKPHRGAKPVLANGLSPLKENKLAASESPINKKSFLPNIPSHRRQSNVSWEATMESVAGSRSERAQSTEVREGIQSASSARMARDSSKVAYVDASAKTNMPESKKSKPSNDTSPKKQKEQQREGEPTGGKEGKFDTLKYNPDGSLRTVHCLPDFMKSFREAMKARYVRFKTKQWFEETFTIEQIFDMKNKEKTLILYKENAEAPVETRSEI